MRIITWNCEGGFSKKADALLALNPDVAIIPECAETVAQSAQARGYSAHKSVTAQDGEVKPLPVPVKVAEEEGVEAAPIRPKPGGEGKSQQ